MAAVEDFAGLAEGHEAVSGAAFAVAGGAEAGDVSELHEPLDDGVEGTAVADVELSGGLALGLLLGVAADAGA